MTPAKELTILVVDDQSSLRRNLREQLRRLGHQVVSASQGAEGLEVLERLEFDLAITDIFMPDVDGLEFIAFARQKNPEMKVIAISGGPHGAHTRYTAGKEEMLHAAELIGADQVLAKPFDLQDLLDAIERALHEEK